MKRPLSGCGPGYSNCGIAAGAFSPAKENRCTCQEYVYLFYGFAWYNSNMTKGKTPPAPVPVNLRMLADHLELSQTTVSLVLNNSPSAKSIPEETRKRVVEAAERLRSEERRVGKECR